MARIGRGTKVAITPADVGAIMATTFSGLNHLDAINGPVVATAIRVRTAKSLPNSPYSQITAQLLRFGKSNNIIQLTVANARQASKHIATTQFYTTLFNQGQSGAFASVVNAKPNAVFLVPVTLNVKAPSGKVHLCELVSFVSKTPRYFLMQTSICSKIADKLDTYHRSTSSANKPGSLLHRCIVQRREEEMQRALKKADAFEWLIREHTSADGMTSISPLIVLALKALIVHDSFFEDAGSRFRDKASRLMSVGNLDKCILNIIQFSTIR